jgi:hypothetical protein
MCESTSAALTASIRARRLNGSTGGDARRRTVRQRLALRLSPRRERGSPGLDGDGMEPLTSTRARIPGAAAARQLDDSGGAA